MTQPDWTERQSSPENPAGVSSQDRPREESRGTEGVVDDVRLAVRDAGSQAKSMATEKAEELQGAAASHLRVFADAVRVAGDELARRETGPVSDLVRQAATGLEQISATMDGKSSAEMIEGVREFGRQNPIGFVAGSLLAGFALARFAGSAAPQSDDRSVEKATRSSPSGDWDASAEEDSAAAHKESLLAGSPDRAPENDASARRDA
jgi:hypothetical protein